MSRDRAETVTDCRKSGTSVQEEEAECRPAPSARSAATNVVAVDRTPGSGTGASAEQRTQQVGPARCDQVAKHPARSGSHQQSRRAVVVPAIVIAVLPAIDAITCGQPPFAITTVVACAVARGIITTLGRIEAVIVIGAVAAIPGVAAKAATPGASRDQGGGSDGGQRHGEGTHGASPF